MYDKMHEDMNALVSQLFSSLISLILVFAVLWFGSLYLVNQAFGKKAATDVQKLGWRIIKAIAYFTEQGARFLWRLLRS